MKCNTFSESHAQADFNDDDGNNMYDKYHEDENDNNDNDDKYVLLSWGVVRVYTR